MNELYLKYSGKGVFRKEEVIKDFPHLKVNAINQKIKEAKKSHWLKGIGKRRALYFIVERRQNYESAQPDSFQLAANITPDAIICYASALMVFGKSHSVLNTMYISSERRFKKLIYQGVEYKYVPLPKREVSVQVISHKGIPLHVTTIERTLVDCLRSLRYSGGFENLYRSYEGVGYMNWKKIEDCLKHFPSKLLKARVGFFVELFKKEWGIPEEFFIHLEKYVPRNPDYFLGREAKSERLIRRRKPKVKPRRFIRRWNLIVPYDVLLKGKYNEKNE